MLDSSRDSALRRCGLKVALVCALVLAHAGTAAAGTETLKRAVSNLMLGPADVALAPITGTRILYQNIQDVEDSLGVRVAYVIPGIFWNSAIQMGGGALRMISGAIELVPGLVMLPFDSDMDPLFTMPDKNDALIWEEAAGMELKIGVNYLQ